MNETLVSCAALTKRYGSKAALQGVNLELGRGRIVDGVGRGIALDRDGNYAKIQKAYECMTLGKGTRYTA